MGEQLTMTSRTIQRFKADFLAGIPTSASRAALLTPNQHDHWRPARSGKRHDLVGPTGPPGPNGPGKGGDDDGGRTGLVTKTRPKTKKPSLYKVLLLNDDYTPMEFVVHILQKYFGKNREEAERVMLHVHQKGVGICGVYTFEIAETKVTQVMDFSRANNHPLQCTMEKE
jgi:ATP-dependent Clp protease adaptor protein ClpS